MRLKYIWVGTVAAALAFVPVLGGAATAQAGSVPLKVIDCWTTDACTTNWVGESRPPAGAPAADIPGFTFAANWAHGGSTIMVPQYNEAVLGFTKADTLTSPVFTVPPVKAYCAYDDGSAWPDTWGDYWGWNAYTVRWTVQLFGTPQFPATAQMTAVVHDYTLGVTTSPIGSVYNSSADKEQMQFNLFMFGGDKISIEFEMNQNLSTGGWFVITNPEVISWWATATTSAVNPASPYKALDGCEEDIWMANQPSWTPAYNDNVIANGGFEGGLGSWLGGAGQPSPAGLYGTTDGLSLTPHSGQYSLLLGKPGTGSATSEVGQSFTAAPTNHTLAFWYDNLCNDSVLWAHATVKLWDLTTGTEVDPLPDTCYHAGWTQVTTPITPGHHYVMSLYNIDDQSGNATMFDDFETW